MEKVTYNLRYYRSRIVKDILKLINIVSEKKLRHNTSVVQDFLNIIKIHIDFDKACIVEKLSNYIESLYLLYLEKNIEELKEKIKVAENSPWDEKKMEEIVALSSEHCAFCSLLDFSLSALPYNIQDEVVSELKKSHKVLFEK